ncbi:dehydrogenase/reductase SDR family member 11-like [Centruroides vittatus]|uniref:dehydrogenase/reductase SDR family member 11-like n=1 Tax=Centruroides vittatus TaxID=120091 RepID=UPI00350FAE7E
MDRWRGRIALVTGASSGIEASLCKELVKNGMRVVGCARNVDAIEKLAEELKDLGHLYSIRCDLNNESEILEMFEEIRDRYDRIDVCINNAGLCKISPLINGDTESWRNMLRVNVLALCICTREAIKLMQEKNIRDGQIIHIGSVLGHKVYSSGGSSFYSGTKYMVRALVEGLRQELRREKSGIRICSVGPGLVDTEFMERMFRNKEMAETIRGCVATLGADDVTNAVINVLKMPEHVDVNDILVRPTEQTF